MDDKPNTPASQKDESEILTPGKRLSAAFFFGIAGYLTGLCVQVLFIKHVGFPDLFYSLPSISAILAGAISGFILGVRINLAEKQAWFSQSMFISVLTALLAVGLADVIWLFLQLLLQVMTVGLTNQVALVPKFLLMLIMVSLLVGGLPLMFFFIMFGALYYQIVVNKTEKQTY